MKTKSAIYSILLAGLLLSPMISCKKEVIKTLATVTIAEITNITDATASSGGTISNGNGTTITERGVCWSIAENPTTKDPKTTNGTGFGAFVSPVTGLTSGTIYNIRAYAVNEMGTAYSAQATFTTLALAPVLTTTELVVGATMTSGGTITQDGGSPVTARGVCWSTTENPTITNTKTTDGDGSGVFTSTVSGLLPGAVYYILSLI